MNIIGYNPDLTAMKSADLYMWLGDGGARDYSGYVGKKVMLYNVATRAKQDVGAVSFWKKSGADLGGRNLTASDVWNCDFSSFTAAGTYRLVVDGVGCSPDFTLSRSVYYEPFKTSIRGFFYMRIGEDKDIKPVPRQPRFIPGKDPPNFKVYLTTYGPFHPDWKRARRGPMGQPRLVEVQGARRAHQPQRLGRPFRRLRLGPQSRPYLDHLGPAAAVSPQQRQAQRRQLPDPGKRQRHPGPH